MNWSTFIALDKIYFGCLSRIVNDFYLTTVLRNLSTDTIVCIGDRVAVFLKLIITKELWLYVNLCLYATFQRKLYALYQNSSTIQFCQCVCEQKEFRSFVFIMRFSAYAHYVPFRLSLHLGQSGWYSVRCEIKIFQSRIIERRLYGRIKKWEVDRINADVE
jgi:hypothetical protein